MNTTIPKAYDPSQVEDRWYAFWLDKGLFHAKAYSRKPAYSIVIPPPNVTGVLTMGHVLNNSIQDILARRARMLGREVLWLPGVDHASIATQTVVERELRKEGKTRHDLGREKFLERVWKWVETHRGIIIQQLKKLGCSCDWTRLRFTMDEKYSRWVTEVFVRLYRKGLIYRGKKLVNWCPVSLTALSDEEVIPKETQGKLYTMKYEVAGNDAKPEYLQIATTRPETLMGDTAVAVHPKDKRYAKLVGGHCWRPFPREKIPIVADDHIDPQFGTGVLKVTPAHDKADFEIGQRHQLPVRDILNPDATLNKLAGPEFDGLDRFKARKLAVEKLQQLGLFVKEEPHVHNVGYSERAGVPVEPRLSEQWFLRYPKSPEALDAVLQGRINYFPERWVKDYEHWLTHIQDWCISRQLWFGQQIPAWYHRKTGEVYVGMHGPGWGDVTSSGVETQRLRADPDNWVQDPDVLDTWFSSWLWPFATMDEDTRKKFFPTSTLVTGPDIIFFWVARMIMASLEFMETVPFGAVYFHGIIRDKQGRKMSKSLGNSPDPIGLIEKYGADGLRFGLMRIAPTGLDIHFDESEIEQGRYFCNKLWNACRFRQMQNPAPAVALEKLGAGDLSSDEKAMLVRLDRAIREIDGYYDRYEFSQVAQKLYELFWTHYCDWFVEASKASLLAAADSRRSACLAVMDHCLGTILKLLHPFMPFITEELWNWLDISDERRATSDIKTIMFEPWPAPFTGELANQLGLTNEILQFTQAKYELITAGRNLKAFYKVPPNKKAKFEIVPDSLPVELMEGELDSIRVLLGAEKVQLVEESKHPGSPTPFGVIHMPLEGLVDGEAEVKRLQGQIRKLEKELEALSQKLSNPSFIKNAPQEVVEKARADLSTRQTEVEKLTKQIDTAKLWA